jgi:glycosyltransferase involved in cell wall biosynthesis
MQSTVDPSVPLRVLLAHNRYRVSGGEERHVDLLANALGEAGITIDVFELTSSDIDVRRARRVALGATLTYRPQARRSLLERFESFRPDVVHFHNIWPLLTPAALHAARDWGAQVLLTLHNFRFACVGGTLTAGGEVHDDCLTGSSLRCAIRNPRQSWFETAAYAVALSIQRRFGLLDRWVDTLIAPSEFAASSARRAGLRSPIDVIPHGVPIAQAAAGRGDYALFAGRLAREKGVQTLLAAAARVPEVPLLVAGAGPLERELRAANDITYLGALASAELDRVRSRARFTVVPSDAPESFGLSAAESMAAGVPVIASRIGALPEAVGDGVTGLLVPPGDAEALADAMQRLWSDPDQASAMGQRAHNVARERYSLERQARRVIAAYEEALRRS